MPEIMGARSDASRVLLGCPRSGPEIVENFPHDGVVGAGIAGCLNSSGQFVAGAATPLVGISRGVSMDHADKNSVTKLGGKVPLRLTDLGALAEGTVEITNFSSAVSETVTIGTFAFVGQSGTAEEGELEFQAASSTGATATSLAAQINAHPGASLIVEAEANAAIVTITSKIPGAAGNAIVLTAGDGMTASGTGTLEDGVDSFFYAVPGNNVFINDTTGLATDDDSGTTNSGWKYDSGPLVGVSPAIGGESAPCALVTI